MKRFTIYRRNLQATCRGGVTLFLAIATFSLLAVTPAAAQNTVPPWYMFDSIPGGSFPPTAPYESHLPNAIVVEGPYPCEGSTYSISSVEQWTTYWINAGYQTVTEITPYSCSGYTTASAYESELNQIEKYVEAHAPNASTDWGGFMLDEEAGWNLSVSILQAINSYTSTLMSGTSGISWYFEEDQPNSWILSTYNSILSNSWPAPQAYSTGTNSMVAAINSECSTYGVCQNLVTIDSLFSYPMNDYVYVTGLVNGSAWQNSYWGSSTWSNYWR